MHHLCMAQQRACIACLWWVRCGRMCNTMLLCPDLVADELLLSQNIFEEAAGM